MGLWTVSADDKPKMRVVAKLWNPGVEKRKAKFVIFTNMADSTSSGNVMVVGGVYLYGEA